MISQILISSLATIYGILTAFILSFRATVEGFLIDPPSVRLFQLIDKKRTQIWDLSRSFQIDESVSAYHSFLCLSSGVVLHYLTTHLLHDSNGNRPNPRYLIVFLHGWPDSSHIWLTVWKHLHHTHPAIARNSVLVAPDLPGFGASDSSSSGYGPDAVLGAVIEFIALVKAQISISGSQAKTIIASHDWGSIIAGRLTLEAPNVADANLLCNAPIIQFADFNVRSKIRSTRAAVGQYRFREAWTSIEPVLSQLQRSYYVFVFNLPFPFSLITQFGFRAGRRCFLRTIARFAVTGAAPGFFDRRTKLEKAVEESMAVHLAGALGPSESAFSTKLPSRAESAADGVAVYPRLVRERTQQRGGWGNVETESIRYYQDGLAWKVWRMSPRVKALYDGLSEQAPSRIKDDDTRRLQKPVKIVWGKNDPAGDWRVLVDGVGSWGEGMVEVRLIDGVGHWVPCEENVDGLNAFVEELVSTLGTQDALH